jgi:hypothetical protein
MINLRASVVPELKDPGVPIRSGAFFARVCPALALARRWHRVEPTAWAGDAIVGSDGTVERQALMSATQLRDVRKGRGLSRQQVAEQASRLNPITARTIEIMETTGRFPNVAGVVAALDHVYRCDGRLGIDQVFDSIAQQASADNQFTVRFPGYYVGPTWIHATGRNANDIGVVDLIWGPWRRQRIRSGMLITTRKALADGPPLIVAIPPGWRVVVGIGAAPTAADINHGWHPVSIRAAIRMLRDGIATIRSSQEIPHANQ